MGLGLPPQGRPADATKASSASPALGQPVTIPVKRAMRLTRSRRLRTEWPRQDGAAAYCATMPKRDATHGPLSGRPDGETPKDRPGDQVARDLRHLQSAHAQVRSAENHVTSVTLHRDRLVRRQLDSGSPVGALARALGIDRRAVKAIVARTAQTRQAGLTREDDVKRRRQQAQAATSWLQIAVTQTERAETEDENGMTEGMLAILAAHVATACAISSLSKSHAAVRQYFADSEAGHGALKNSRDLMAHFDKYTEGDGNMQRAKVDGVRVPNPTDARPPLLPMWNGGSSQELAFLTKTWARGDNMEFLLQDGKPLRDEQGRPRMESLQIAIDVKDAIRATAKLVDEARTSTDCEPHPEVRNLLRRATQ